jgi:hypothetical protein
MTFHCHVDRPLNISCLHAGDKLARDASLLMTKLVAQNLTAQPSLGERALMHVSDVLHTCIEVAECNGWQQ